MPPSTSILGRRSVHLAGVPQIPDHLVEIMEKKGPCRLTDEQKRTCDKYIKAATEEIKRRLLTIIKSKPHD